MPTELERTSAAWGGQAPVAVSGDGAFPGEHQSLSTIRGGGAGQLSPFLLGMNPPGGAEDLKSPTLQDGLEGASRPPGGIPVPPTVGVAGLLALGWHHEREVSPASAAHVREVSPSSGLHLIKTTTHNSTYSLRNYCPSARWVVGRCVAHGRRYYVRVGCKRRGCEVCGPRGRLRLATRIAEGIAILGPCVFMVLTLAQDKSKVDVVRALAGFVRSLRKLQPQLQYAATYEETRNGRLHVNLVCGPWRGQLSRGLQQWLVGVWGHWVWLTWVRGGLRAGDEMMKAGGGTLSLYMVKLEQSVKAGRRVSFSAGWPSGGRGVPVERGRIMFSRLDARAAEELERAMVLGELVGCGGGVYVRSDGDPPEGLCDCWGLTKRIPPVDNR